MFINPIVDKHWQEERQKNRMKCLTCRFIPTLFPCKTLSGPSMQFTGNCQKRKATSSRNSGGRYTAIWIDFESLTAWEEAGSDITECEGYSDIRAPKGPG